MTATAILAPVLVSAGLLAILDVGGTAADVGGLLAIVAALFIFARVVFRVAAGDAPLAGEQGPRRLR
jgi:hypothetical protein